MCRSPRPGPLAGPLLALFTALTPGGAYAQTPPPTQDDQVRSLLGLGNASGCFALLGVPNNSVDVSNKLQELSTQFGNGLRAICASSAVTSSSFAGGGINTRQLMRSVSQVAPYDRLDKRLRSIPTSAPTAPPLPPTAPRNERTFGWQVGPTAIFEDAEGSSGMGVFGGIERESRGRFDTSYESGYDSHLNSLTAGLDYLHGRTLVGGWIGRTREEGDFRRFSPLVGGPLVHPTFQAELTKPGVLAGACGGLSSAGSFEQRSTRFGGFIAWAADSGGFADVAVGWTRREHVYARNVCAIEAQGPVIFTGGALRDADDNTPLDDIFAGTISGLARTHELDLAFRTGADLGNDVVLVTPRATLTWARSSAGAYSETGASTVFNTIEDVDGDDFMRRRGDPIGLELAFDPLLRRSMRLDAGGEVAVRIGPIAPHAGVTWHRALQNAVPLVTARFAQDLRPVPRRFQFGLDTFDPQSFVFGFGVTAAAGRHFAARFDITRLYSDVLFTSHAWSGQARVRF